MKNFVCASLLLVLAGLIVYRIRWWQTERPGVPTDESDLRSPLRDVPIERLREAFHEEYRLRPDRRWLVAIADIHRFLTGKAKAAVETRFENQQWDIYYNDKIVGTIPELPAYSDLMRLAVQWSRSNLESASWSTRASRTVPEEITAGLDEFLSPNVLRALESANHLWDTGERSPELLRLAARGLILLTVQWADSMEVGDDLPAQAIALLAVAKSLAPSEGFPEECLLAETLGYHAAAAEIATGLDSGSVERLFVLAQDDSLRKTDSSMARYLWLLRLKEQLKWDEWSEWVTQYYPGLERTLAIETAGLSDQEFGRYRDYSEALHETASREVQEKCRAGSVARERLRRIEVLLRSLPRQDARDL